ncbi:MAG: methyltransferase domain-containing protein [Dehalococcoidales bacterium]|nr:methyltransferase domain-containing protein [Dehalococcoidales bacterium]
MTSKTNSINPEYVRESYNSLITKLDEDDYKNYRWFKNDVAFQQYLQTEVTIKSISELEKYRDILEIGCGPGTWTDILSKTSQNLVAVDISKEMINQATDNVKSKNVSFVTGDFLDNSILSGKQFDAIYSIRAFEYFRSKEEAIKKAKSLLRPGGTVFIITKNPKYSAKVIIDILFRAKIINSDSRWLPANIRNLVKTYSSKLHSDWIEVGQLRKIMEQEGFRSVQSYPAVIGIGFSSRIWRLFTSIHSKIYRRPLSPVLTPLMESYLITGVK